MMTQGTLFDAERVPFEVPSKNPHDRPQSGFFDLPAEVRFKLDRRGERDCWVYLFSNNPDSKGYGVVNHEGRPTLVHRLTWRILVGNIPEGSTLDHLCETKACANPAHLELVSTGENTRRHHARRRAENAFSPASEALAEAYSMVVCPVCGEEFKKTRDWHTYCSPACRSKGNKRLKLVQERIPAPFVQGSETSREAAERIEPNAGTERQRVLELLRRGGALTDEQIQKALGMDPNTERPRRVELVRGGFVRDSGVTGLTRAGRKAVRWEAT